MIEKNDEQINIKEITVGDPTLVGVDFDYRKHLIGLDMESYMHYVNGFDDAKSQFLAASHIKVLAPDEADKIRMRKYHLDDIVDLTNIWQGGDEKLGILNAATLLYEVYPHMREEDPVDDQQWNKLVASWRNDITINNWRGVLAKYRLMSVIRPSETPKPKSTDISTSAIKDYIDTSNMNLNQYLESSKCAKLMLPERPDIYMPSKSKWTEIEIYLRSSKPALLKKESPLPVKAVIEYFSILTNAAILAADRVQITEWGVEIFNNPKTFIQDTQLPKMRRF